MCPREKKGTQHVTCQQQLNGDVWLRRASISSLPSPTALCEWAKENFRAVKPAVYPENVTAIEIMVARKHTQDVCSNARVEKRAKESSHPRHPPPGLLTICIASSIHFSVSSAVTEHAPPPVAGVDAAFASIRHPGRGARRQRLGAQRSAGNGTRRLQATVSREVERRCTRERILNGPAWPGPVSGGRGAAAATESAAAQL